MCVPHFSSDPRFPENGKVEFVFGNNSEGLVQGKRAEADQESSTHYFFVAPFPYADKHWFWSGTKLFDTETIADRIFWRKKIEQKKACKITHHAKR